MKMFIRQSIRNGGHAPTRTMTRDFLLLRLNFELVAPRVRRHINPMTRILLITGLVAFMPSAGFTAEEKPASAVDIQARKESVANLETHIAQREERLAEWGRDIVEIDARIEKQVADLVKMIAGLRDSKDSRTAVSKLKKDAIDGLQRGIDLYIRKRKEVRELVRTGQDDALGDLGKFDKRIITRVDQIAEITKSIPTHQDVDKYKSDGGSYWNGYYTENTRVSEDWKQNRRDSGQSAVQKKETQNTLRKGLERLDQRRRTLKDLLTDRDLTESARNLYTTELGQVDAYEEHLNAQLRDVATSTGGGGQAVSRDQVSDIEDIFNDARADLREEVSRLFHSYDRFARGRAYLEGLKEQLAERKKWLELHAADSPANP